MRGDPGDVEAVRVRVGVAGGDARDVRAVVVDVVDSDEGECLDRIRRPRRGERPRDDDLWRRVGRVPFREAGWVGQSGRIEERMPLVDALVDDRDLHAVPCGRERRAPERRRADQPRGAVERGVVRDAWPDPGDAADPREPGDVSCRRDDGEPVDDDGVVPAHVRGRDRALDPRGERPLRGLELMAVGNAPR